MQRVSLASRNIFVFAKNVEGRWDKTYEEVFL